MADYETAQGVGVVGGSVEGFESELDRAYRLHHLATADPEPERGIGTETGPAHEKRFGLERADASAEYWRSVGVHPFENRALKPGDDGYVSDDDVQAAPVETATAAKSTETAAAPRANSNQGS